MTAQVYCLPGYFMMTTESACLANHSAMAKTMHMMAALGVGGMCTVSDYLLIPFVDYPQSMQIV